MMKDECGMMNWQNESSSLDFHELRKDFSPPVTWKTPGNATLSLAIGELIG
jgi:hypothetical protein